MKLTKIRINCYNCMNSTGCEIKKKFRDLVKTISPKKADWDNTIEMETEFELICPFYDNKYNHIDTLDIRFGIGRYLEDYTFPCPLSGDGYNGDECDGNCKFEGRCDGYNVSATRMRVTEYIETKARVLGGRKNKIYVAITLDSEMLNDFDIKHLSKFSEKIFDGDADRLNISYTPYYGIVRIGDKVTFKTVIRGSQILKKGEIKWKRQKNC